MCILTGGWNPDCSRPVVIQMSHLIGQPLEMISLHPNAVMDTDVMSRGDCALSDMLRHNEEVKLVSSCDCMVHNGSWWWIVKVSLVLEENPGIDPLLYNDH